MRSALLLARSARVRPVARTLTAVRYATTQLTMPALSPTMTEGGVGAWKKKEGETFEAGDVLVEIETDKASVEVEAQEDGVMGKILVDGGSKNVPVGKPIALLAEEGDDLTKLEVPDQGGAAQPAKEEPAAKTDETPKEPETEKVPKQDAPSGYEAEKSEPPKTHSDIDPSINIFPAAERLLWDHPMSNEQLKAIKPTGKHNKITRGDILAALGKIDSPYGTAVKYNTDPLGPSGRRKSEGPRPASEGQKPAPPPEKPLDGPALRRLIVAGLGKAAAPRPAAAPDAGSLKPTDAEYDDIFGDYFPSAPKPTTPPPAAAESQPKQDELAGLF